MKIERSKMFLAAIILLGIGLRLYRLGAHSFWYDEASSVAESMNILNVINAHFLTTPPLFGVILHFWSFLGEGEFLLRLLPALFGMLTVIMSYKFGRMLFNKKVGLISAFLLAVSPFHIYYSQELRAYTLLTFLSLMSIYYFWKSLKRDSISSWICFTIFTILCVYTQNIALFLLVVINSFLLLFYKKYRNLLVKFLKFQFVIFLFCIPWFIVVYHQVINVGILNIFFWVPEPSFLTLIHTINIFNLGYNATRLEYLLAFLIFSAVFFYGIWAGRKEKSNILLLLWLCLPIILAAVVSLISKTGSIYLYRTFVFLLVPYYTIVANGLGNCKKYLTVLSLICIVVFLSLSVFNYYRDIFPLPVYPYRPGVFAKKENKSAAAYIENNFKNGDVIAHTCRSTYGAFVLYHKGKFEERRVLLNNNIELDSWSKVYYKLPGNRVLFNLEAVDIRQFIKNKERVWLVLSGWELDEIDCRDIKVLLDNNYVLLDIKKFKGIELYLYDISSLRNHSLVYNNNSGRK